MLSLNQFHNLTVNLILRIRRACQGCVTAKILICHGFHSHHIKVITHTIAGDHGPGNLGCLFNVIGCTGRYLTKYHFLRSTATGKCCNLILQFLLCQKIFVSLLYLHGITKRAGSSWNDRNLLNRCRMCLHCCYKSVSNLMICNYLFLLI